MCNAKGSAIMRRGIFVVVFLISSLPSFGQEKRTEVKYTASLSGQDMFQTWCATCHGTDAKGNGPAAAALKKAPPDLTQLKKQNHGKFPTERVRSYVDGTATPSTPAHGSREMPVWGDALKALDPTPAAITYRVFALASYVESIQAK
jgi:mono/diheme cytochrome c family protein